MELREKYGADVVAMIIDNSGGYGPGILGPRLKWMFSVADFTCVTENYSFGNEISHNLGLSVTEDQ